MMNAARQCLVLIAALSLGAQLAHAEAAKPRKATKADIVGKWEEATGGELIEFSEGGAFSSQSGDVKFAGTYKFLPDGKMQIDLEGPIAKTLGSLVRTATIDNHELTLTDPEGRSLTYHRPKP